jgi:uncharacterized phage-associated protein
MIAKGAGDGFKMRFRFNERKAAQAAAHLLQLHGGRLNYMVLIKLLYLADRQVLLKCGRPLTGDRFVSMDHGPVLSIVLSLINMGRHERQSPWFEYISGPSEYEVALLERNPDTDELSEYELQVLENVNAEFGDMDKWDLVEFIHTLPEWENPDGSSIPIEPEKIMRLMGLSDDEIEHRVNDAEDAYFLDRLGAS